MGQASLAAPPQDFLATANKAAPDPEPMPDGSAPGSAAGPSGPTLAAASPGSEILRIQEDGTLFQKGAAWVGIHSATGYDLTDAAGTICSGRPAGLAAAITPGQRIAMACSDGRNATLLVTATNAGGGSGQMIVGGARQSADILQGN